MQTASRLAPPAVILLVMCGLACSSSNGAVPPPVAPADGDAGPGGNGPGGPPVDATDADGGSDAAGGAVLLSSAQVAQLAVGRIHTCALTTTGAVRCWGDNSKGQLGTGTTDPEARVPVAVKGLTSGVKAIASSVDHACAVTSTGGVQCWGYGSDGQLGSGSQSDTNPSPLDVPGLTGVKQVATGDSHSCALTDAGGVKCWGKNDAGQLGNGSDDPNSLTPVDVTGLASGVASIAAGRDHTCAVTAAGGAKCWGSNLFGEQGNGVAGDGVKAPGDVVGFTTGVSSVSAGDGATCLTTTSGTIQCFGKNDHGQLGNGSGGTGVEEHSPVAVSAISSGATAVAVGWGFACALATGAVKCWGYNDDLSIGNGEGPSFETHVPVAASGVDTGIAMLAASPHRTCAVTTAGAMKCWGSTALGNDASKAVSDQNSGVPVPVLSLP